MGESGGAAGPGGIVIVAAGTGSLEGQGGALNGFKGFMPTGQGSAVGAAFAGGTSVVWGADPGGDITTVGSGGKFLVASIGPTSVKLKEPITSLETSLDLTKEGAPGTS